MSRLDYKTFDIKKELRQKEALLEEVERTPSGPTLLGVAQKWGHRLKKNPIGRFLWWIFEAPMKAAIAAIILAIVAALVTFFGLSR